MSRNTKKGSPKNYLIVLILGIVLAIFGIQSPDFLDDFFGNSSQIEVTEPSVQEGVNQGPREHGKSNFSKSELKSSNKGWITYGELDEYGRPTAANALITPNMINTGTSASQSIRPPGFISGLDPHNHSRGHLIGRQLGGTGESLENLVTLYQNPVNTPFMTKYENMIRKAVDDGDSVRYRVTPIYKDDIPMPIAVDMEAKGLKKQSNIDFSVTIDNLK